MILGAISLGLPPSGARALVFASPDTEPATPLPPDFPYWEYVTQRRYEGPSVIYLGAGFALTARHVGMGEIFLSGEIYSPMTRSKHTLLNENGTAADAMIFELDRSPEPPDWPLLPLADRPPERGEDLVLIGFGRGRGRVVEYAGVDGLSRFAFAWSDDKRKRWGTNRIDLIDQTMAQDNFVTRSFTFEFDPPYSGQTTPHEAQAAVGDSGGAVFVKRDGEWQLLGMMISVSAHRDRANGDGDFSTSSYGDQTYAVDLTQYREEILRWTRPACSNERDDDGDDRIDFPQDPGCSTASDRDERDEWPSRHHVLGAAVVAAVGLVLLASAVVSRLRRGRPPAA
jgi:hypothetical protein